MQVHQALLESVPGFRERLHKLEHTVEAKMTKAGPKVFSVVTIPVVVHVVYNVPAQNLSAAQVKSQITVLNKDYRATNPDKSKTPAPWAGLVTDTKIQFKLATKDPSGKPTTGITRTKTTKKFFTTDDGVKFASKGGINPWNTKKYLNVWVVPDLRDAVTGDALLGYAQFPLGPAAKDGVVILHSAFGTKGTVEAPFNLGRTTTHEIGHYLNLRHIWADTEDCSGSDRVDDTPNAATPNYGKPKFPHITCKNGPNGDMFVNYMDYVDDLAMFMFTTGQVARMRATLAGPRKPLIS